MLGILDKFNERMPSPRYLLVIVNIEKSMHKMCSFFVGVLLRLNLRHYCNLIMKKGGNMVSGEESAEPFDSNIHSYCNALYSCDTHYYPMYTPQFREVMLNKDTVSF